MKDRPKISFGIIVLNGEPFTKYCLKALYPFAYELIVVEGAAPAAAAIATPDGHSTDATLETLYRFKSEEDPEDKLKIVVREGFWNEKDEQSKAYAERATGDYLWQVDIDEFYKEEDILAVMEILAKSPDVTAVSFRQLTFWGDFDYVVDGWYLRGGAEVYHRLFKWGGGFEYSTHRPPTVRDSLGRNVRTLRWIDGSELARKGVYLYHYSLLFPKQVFEKCQYYKSAIWANREGAVEWADQNFMKLRNPFRVHNVYKHPSWIRRFNGTHPSQIEALRIDLNSGLFGIPLRPTHDINALIRTLRYRLGRFLLIAFQPCDKLLRVRQFKLPLIFSRSARRFLRLLVSGIEWFCSNGRSK
jgi:glycosyltransferase involved in cell wall biosynthesis